MRAACKSPGAQTCTPGAGVPCQATAAGTPTLATGGVSGTALTLRLAPFTALDPGAMAALGLAGARLWGALA